MSFVGDEDYDYERSYRRRPSAHRNQTDYRRSQHFLNPNASVDQGGLYRTRSQGHGPLPVVNVYNDIIQDSNQSQDPRLYPPYPPSPEFRGRRDRLGDELADDFVGMALENQRLRSRSRGRSDAAFGDRRDDLYEYELRQKLRDLEERARWDKEEERIKAEVEMQRLKDEAKKKADDAASKAEKDRIIAEHDRKRREDEEDAKAEEKRIREKIEREKIEKKEKEEREYAEFLQKQKDKAEKEKREKEEKEKEIEDEMRKRLSKAGFTYNQIEAMVKDEKKKTTTTTTTTTLDVWNPSRAPVYAKVHRDYLSVDTLRYYDVPYEYDRNDSNFIIILREMDRHETDVLFEHTRRLRQGKLLLEPAKEKPQYAFYRKRDRSSSRVRKLGVLEYTSKR